VQIGHTTDHAGNVLHVAQDDRYVVVTSDRVFETLDEAEAARLVTIRGLGLLGVALGYGIDEYVTYATDEEGPGHVRNIRFTVLPDGEIDLGLSIRFMNQRGDVGEPYVTATKLFNASFSTENKDVALALRTTALEVMSAPQRRDDEFVDSIDKAIEAIRGLVEVPDEHRVRLINALGREKSESISEAVRRRVRELVPEAPDDVVAEIYSERSKVVHGRSTNKERIHYVAENARHIVRALILRDLGFGLGPITVR
jgi:hypothetical protein